jgi:methylmalonyl-CoA/ethylmalonyl-CoA epimerase
MKKIEHIGIAVHNLEESNQLFKKILNTKPYKEESVAGEKVRTSFFMLGDVKIELLEATEPDSPIAVHLEKRGPGVHHIAFHVEDINKEIERLQQEGFRVLNRTPKDGADNKRIAFLHPSDTGKVLIELCEDKAEEL